MNRERCIKNGNGGSVVDIKVHLGVGITGGVGGLCIRICEIEEQIEIFQSSRQLTNDYWLNPVVATVKHVLWFVRIALA